MSSSRKYMDGKPADGLEGGYGSLTYAVVRDLGRAIVAGHYSHAHPLPYETALCAQFSVSRPVLREAVKILATKGLVAARPRRGTWVSQEASWNLFDPDVFSWLLEQRPGRGLLDEVDQLREAIGARAASVAATSSPAQRRAVSGAVERLSAAVRGEDDPMAAEIAFHDAILHAGHNRFFSCWAKLAEVAVRDKYWRGEPSFAGPADLQIYDAIAQAVIRRRAKAAERLYGQLIASDRRARGA